MQLQTEVKFLLQGLCFFFLAGVDGFCLRILGLYLILIGSFALTLIFSFSQLEETFFPNILLLFLFPHQSINDIFFTCLIDSSTYSNTDVTLIHGINLYVDISYAEE